MLGNTTVDGVLRQFSKTIKKLNNIAKANRTMAAQDLKVARRLTTQAEDRAREALRAEEVANKIANLIS